MHVGTGRLQRLDNLGVPCSRDFVSSTVRTVRASEYTLSRSPQATKISSRNCRSAHSSRARAAAGCGAEKRTCARCREERCPATVVGRVGVRIASKQILRDLSLQRVVQLPHVRHRPRARQIYSAPYSSDGRLAREGRRWEMRLDEGVGRGEGSSACCRPGRCAAALAQCCQVESDLLAPRNPCVSQECERTLPSRLTSAVRASSSLRFRTWLLLSSGKAALIRSRSLPEAAHSVSSVVQVWCS